MPEQVGSVTRIAALFVRSSGRRVLFELPLLGAVAAVVVFFVCLALKAPIDGATFFGRASFDRVTVTREQPPEYTGDAAYVFPRFPVVKQRPPGDSLAFTPELQPVEVDFVEDLERHVASVLGNNVQAWDGAIGALVDEDTARKLGVGIGDGIVLNGLVTGASVAPDVPVVGLLAPYINAESRSGAGIVVVPTSAVSQEDVAELAQSLRPGDEAYVRLYNPPDGTSALTRGELVLGFIGQLLRQETIVAVVGVAVFAGILWVAAVSRGSGHQFRRAQPLMAVLVALGVSPRSATWAALLPQIVLVLLAQLVGAVAVAWFIFPVVLGWGLQIPVIAPAFILLTVGGAIVFVISAVAVHRGLARGLVLATLSRSEE